LLILISRFMMTSFILPLKLPIQIMIEIEKIGVPGCFKLDFSIEIIHIVFGISKIFSRGWLTSSKAGNKLFHWTIWNCWYTTSNLQKWQFYMVQTNSSLYRKAQLICRVKFTVHSEVIRISIFLHYSSVLLTDDGII